MWQWRRATVPLVLAVLGSACGTADGRGSTPSATPTATSPATDGLPTLVPDDDPSGAVDRVDLEAVTLAYEVVAEGFEAPVLALPRPGFDEVWVLEQPGRIHALLPDLTRRLVVDLTDRVRFGGERGLLGMAFMPDHATAGGFVLHYSALDRGGDTRVERWTVDAETAVADGVVLEVEQPAGNHNGGMIQFGPDGMLWIALGDGGGANDGFGNGQRPDTLLGAMLRLDLSVRPYAVPPDNPFVDGRTPEGRAAAPEVWAYGLRNPWRTWIDGQLLYVADVGQGRIEEVDVVNVSRGGLNFGWPVREGSQCLRGSDCPSDGFVPPITEYTHDDGCSITGGMVARGPALPDLDGHWFYSDFCGGFLRSLRVADDGSAADERDWIDQVGVPTQVISFGLDWNGDLLVLGADGALRRIVQV